MSSVQIIGLATLHNGAFKEIVLMDHVKPCYFFKLWRNWAQIIYQQLEIARHYKILATTGKFPGLELPFADFTYKVYLQSMLDA